MYKLFILTSLGRDRSIMSASISSSVLGFTLKTEDCGHFPRRYNLQHHFVIHERKDPANEAEANPGRTSAWGAALHGRPGIDKTQVVSPSCKES